MCVPGQGRLRNAYLTKDGFQLSAADRIPFLLDGFEKQFLARSGEPKSLARSGLISYLAECHVEFILIHPFREELQALPPFCRHRQRKRGYALT